MKTDCQQAVRFILQKLLTKQNLYDKILKSHTEGYRSGHNEAVLKTSFVCLCNFLKALDFIGFFASSDALCEKPFSQFSRKFP